MSSILKLFLPIFSTVKNYEDTLYRLAYLCFFQVLIISFLLRQDPNVDSFFSNIETHILGELWEEYIKIPNQLGVIASLALAVLTRVFHFHNLLAKFFKIRRKFDYEYIVKPLAENSGVSLTPEKKLKLLENRNDVMREIFYKYASSRSDAPLVDKHDIEHARSTVRKHTP